MPRRKDSLDPDQRLKHRLSIYKKVFGSEDGKSVLRDLCRLHNVFGSLPPSASFQEFAWDGGKRDVIFGIINTINEDPSFKMNLMREIDEYEL